MLTVALESPSLIGMLMRAQTPDWPSGLASMVVKQLFDKFEPQDTMSLIDMNCVRIWENQISDGWPPAHRP